MWSVHGHTMSYCNFWTYPIGEFVLVAINWRNQLKGDLVIVRGHAIATALWPYGPAMGAAKHRHTASWNPESSRFHIFSNLFHLVLLVTVDFPDDVGWFAAYPYQLSMLSLQVPVPRPLPGPAQTRRVSFFDLTGQGSSEFPRFLNGVSLMMVIYIPFAPGNFMI